MSPPTGPNPMGNTQSVGKKDENEMQSFGQSAKPLSA